MLVPAQNRCLSFPFSMHPLLLDVINKLLSLFSITHLLSRDLNITDLYIEVCYDQVPAKQVGYAKQAKQLLYNTANRSSR